MMRVTKRFTFEAAHILPLHEGKCKNLHGHGYVLEVGIEGQVDTGTGMVIDFGDISQAVKLILDDFDHAFIAGPNTPNWLMVGIAKEGWRLVELPSEPTAEIIAMDIGERLRALFSEGTRLSIKVWETEKCSVSL